MEITAIVKIAHEHTDELGHLSHVEAVRLFEAARSEWYRVCGLYNNGSEGLWQVSSVVVNVKYSYRSKCFLGEAVKVVTRSGAMGTKSFTLRHQLIKSNGQIAIEGSATSVIMDTTKRLIIPVPACLAEHLPSRS